MRDFLALDDVPPRCWKPNEHSAFFNHKMADSEALL